MAWVLCDVVGVICLRRLNVADAICYTELVVVGCMIHVPRREAPRQNVPR